MPRVPKASPKGRKKKIITAILVVLLLLAGVGAGVFWRWHQSQNSSGSSGGANGSQVSNGQSDGLNQNKLPVSVKSAQDLAATGNYDQSNKEIATSIATTSSSDEKYELYIQQGVNAENQSQWDSAIAA